MLQNFLVSVNAVVPFLFYLTLGYGVRAAGKVDETFLNRLTKLVFAIMFPFMTFYNVYSADQGSLPSTTLLIFVGCSILLLEFFLLLVVPKLVKENARRGVIIQAVFRSNFVIFGLPLTVSVFGPEKAATAAMLVTEVVTIYNITAVIVLEIFNENGKAGHKLSVKSLLLRLVQNPLLQGCAVGLVFYFLRIRLPGCIANPIASFANMTTPLAMFALGGTLQFSAIKKNLRYLVPGLTAKLILIPLIMIPLAYLLGLRGVELFLVLVVFGAPVAAASYPMAMNMGGDGELAGQFVYISTALSVVTLFVWIFCLGSLGLLAL